MISARTLKHALTTSLIIGGLSAPMLALANDKMDRHNLISFEVSVQDNIANDEALAVMTKAVSAKNAKELANKINPIINQALTLAKAYPSVEVSTGSQHAYPEYSKGKIIGVTGSASLTLKSQDTEALSNLMAELQNSLLLERLDFSVSDELRDSTTQALRDKATQKFKQEAQAMVSAWGAKGYHLINAQMNTGGQNLYQPKYYTYDAVAVVEQASAPRQTLEAGNSTISYTINGTIQLTY